MGAQSCVVIVGFICLHVALILNVIALSTPYWIEGTRYNVSVDANATNSSVNKGLWRICYDDDCSSVIGTDQEGWFHAVQTLFTLTMCFCLFALVMYYAFFILATRREVTLRLNTMMAIIVLIALICGVVSITLYGKEYDTDEDVHEDTDDLGWSYYIAVGGTVMTALSAVLICYEGYLIRKEEAPYENI